jgi:hypothetical protein
MISHLARRCTSLHIHSSSTVFLTTQSHAIAINTLYYCINMTVFHVAS